MHLLKEDKNYEKTHKSWYRFVLIYILLACNWKLILNSYSFFAQKEKLSLPDYQKKVLLTLVSGTVLYSLLAILILKSIPSFTLCDASDIYSQIIPSVPSRVNFIAVLTVNAVINNHLHYNATYFLMSSHSPHEFVDNVVSFNCLC